MFNFKKKNYLKRTDFINLVDSNKIWSKSLTLSEIKELLDYLEKEMSKYEFKEDKNFLMDGRRNGLKLMIEQGLLKNEGKRNENVLESLFNFWEFVNNEYYTTSDTLQRYNITRQEMDTMCMEYTRSGIICIQERDVILEMMQLIKNYITESCN